MSSTKRSQDVPKTPPRRSHGSSTHKQIPLFDLPLKTPNRQSTRQHQLQTPATANVVGFSASHTNAGSTDITPRKSGSAGKTPSHASCLFPPTPDFTPQKSPRGKRKKMCLEDMFVHTECISMLLPNHSTVGSGRKQPNSGRSLRGSLPLSPVLTRSRGSSQLYQDEPESPTKYRKPRKNLLATPGNQLITEEKVNSWHGNSFHGSFSSDEDSDYELHSDSKSKELVNPFIIHSPQTEHANSHYSSRGKATPFNTSKPQVNYETHLELINHRTGERKVEMLSEDQKKVKPKKIDFSTI